MSKTFTPHAADLTVRAICRAYNEGDRGAFDAMYHTERSAEEWKAIAGVAIHRVIDSWRYMEEVQKAVLDAVRGADLESFSDVHRLDMDDPEDKGRDPYQEEYERLSDHPDDPLERAFLWNLAHLMAEEENEE